MLIIYLFHWYPPSPFAQPGAWHFQWISTAPDGPDGFQMHALGDATSLKQAGYSAIEPATVGFQPGLLSKYPSWELAYPTLGKRKVIFKSALGWDMWVPWRVFLESGLGYFWTCQFGDSLRGKGFGKRDSHVSLEHLKWALNITCCFSPYIS